MSVEVFPDIDELIRTTADEIVKSAQEAVAARGRFLFALSGGNSPRPLYRLLANSPYRERIPWEQTFVLWSDERFVPLDDPRSNAGIARELLLNHVPVPADHVLPMYADDKTPEQAAAAYESTLKSLGGEVPRLDLTLLGCGTDGHTASLFPHSPLLEDTESLVHAVHPAENGFARITMTPRLLNQSRKVMFIVYGKDKVDTIQEVLEGPYRPNTLPAQIIRPSDGDVLWHLDLPVVAKLTMDHQPS